MNDFSKFRPVNVADTCSVWNLLASRSLYSAAKQAMITVCCTEFVRYECLYKPGHVRPERVELQGRLQREISNGRILPCAIDLEDLQDIEALDQRKKISKGELSSMVFAKRTQQAFMTDDNKAAKLAKTIMAADYVQSTPHLMGWLFFMGKLEDSDLSQIIDDLKKFERNLEAQLKNAYQEALRCRLMASRVWQSGS